MQTIEFISESHDRMIPIPEQYQNWFKKPVKVKIVLLAMEPSNDEEVIPQENADLNCFAGTLSLTEKPLKFQKCIRGEWS